MIVSLVDPVRNADLAALARTCTSFHEIALDELWRHQDTIMNLIRCMPADLWTSTTDIPAQYAMFASDLLDSAQRLTRPIVASDWHRPLKYSHRVKSLSCGYYWDPDLIHVFQALRLCIPAYLLPNLHGLSWYYPHA
ncbi:hypothetical protein DFH07DRAFT_733536, partial [Mycena maculata]